MRGCAVDLATYCKWPVTDVGMTSSPNILLCLGALIHCALIRDTRACFPP